MRLYRLGRALFVPLVLLLLISMSGCSDPNWSEEKIRETQARGDLIIGALEKYRSDTGKYPKTLEQLAPNYLVEIEPPTAGKMEWQYLSGGKNFSLYFAKGSASEPEYVRTNTSGKWSLVPTGF